ncbi:class I SAM-dependent methyltransferase [Helicobacter sp. 23-1045]
MQNTQNKQSKDWLLRFARKSYGLRCCFGLFSRETSEIGLGRPSSEVLCENNSNEYPKANCQKENAPKLTSIRGIDPSNEMLKIAAQKLPPSVILQNGEAKDLRVDSDSVDILSIAYGLRNVVEVDSALKEFHRVLRKNGILVILEFSKKDNENIFDKIARFYTKRILPYIGGFISKNYAAYKYLPNSVDGFLSLEQIAHKLQNLGFGVKFSKRYFCNVCSLIIAQKDSAQKDSAQN